MSLNNYVAQWRDLSKKVKFLKRSDSYIEEDCSMIDAVQTHMSWVFLTDHYAYKLKKPVKFSFLDLSLLETRHLNCIKELKLNQFLAPDVYLNIVPLMQNDTGQFYPVGSDEQGTVVDWLLKMRRLPQELTLKQALLQNKVDFSLVTKAAKILTDFYQKAKPVKMKPNEYNLRLRQCINENFNVLAMLQYGLDQTTLKTIQQQQLKKLHSLSNCIAQRIAQGRIIECHGDLRPEHIYLTSRPLIIDRLEFNDALRIMDPVEEISYLTLECELLGRPDIGSLFFTIYEKALNDSPSLSLLAFYKSYRASLRAKICAWHLDDPRVEELEKWHQRAKSYLDLSLNSLD